MSDIATVRLKSCRLLADFAFLCLIRPALRLSGCLFQFYDFLLMLLILLFCRSIPSSLILLPTGKVPALYLYALPVQHQDMVDTGIQKIPVMRDQNKPAG